MKCKTFNYLLYFLLGILFYSCATVGRPEGGPRDVSAPRMIVNESAPNLVTDEKKRSWLFTFDEFVKLDNPGKNIIVSPPLRYNLDVKIRGKRVVVELDDREILKENTTYIFNFGRTVQDITEGNSANDVMHVFSTGPIIDSLQLSGQLLSSYSGDTLINYTILLYDNLADTAIRTLKPSYLTFTDSTGFFLFDYIRNDTFSLFALEDKNNNLYYDGPPERIAFLGEAFLLESNSSIIDPLILFEEEISPLIEKHSFSEGLLELELSHPFFDTPSIELIGLEAFDYVINKKRINVWYDGDVENNSQVIFDYGELQDTSKIRYLKSEDKERQNVVLGNQSMFASADGMVRIHSKMPIIDFNRDSIFLLFDSLVVDEFVFEQIDQYNFNCLINPSLMKHGAIIVFDDGAMTAFNDESNDSISFVINAYDQEKRGNLMLIIEQLDSALQYVIYLKNPGGNFNITMTASNVVRFEREFKDLMPGEFEIIIIEDLDRNIRWTSGDLDKKRLPERVFSENLNPLKANWDLEAKVLLRFGK